jgi:hypothetical protein
VPAMSLIWWKRSTIGWTEDGYVLHMEHSLQHRAALRFERKIRTITEAQEWDVAVRVEPMVQHHTSESSSADLGSLQLIGETVQTLDAERLREQLDALADEADKEIAAVLEQEQALAEDFLRKLRGEP